MPVLFTHSGVRGGVITWTPDSRRTYYCTSVQHLPNGNILEEVTS